MSMLVSLADMKDYLGVGDTSQDDFLTDQITIISDAIEGYCGRVFTSTSYVQTFYGEDYKQDLNHYKLFTFHYPLTAITQVQEIEKFEDASESVTTLTTDEFLFEPKSGKIQRTFVDGNRISWFYTYGFHSRVEVTYTAGYSTVPSIIKDVVFNLVEQRYNKKISGIRLDFGSDVQRVSIPGVMSLDFDYTLQSNERSSRFGMILGNYSNVLDHYRSERRLIGDIKDIYVS